MWFVRTAALNRLRPHYSCLNTDSILNGVLDMVLKRQRKTDVGQICENNGFASFATISRVD